MINQLYDESVSMVHGLLRRNKISEPAENYVNEAWLHLTESGAEVSVDSMYKTARHLILDEITTASYKKGDNKSTTKVCGGCKQDLPIGCFGMSYDKLISKKRVNYYCRECDNKRQRNYPKEKCKENLNRSIVNLSDGYVKKNLRNLGFKNKNITADMIIECRKRISEKRLMYNSQKSFSFGFPLDNLP